MHFFFTRFFKVLWLHLIFTLPSSMLFIWSVCYQTRIHCASELRLTILDLFVYEYFSFFFFFFWISFIHVLNLIVLMILIYFYKIINIGTFIINITYFRNIIIFLSKAGLEFFSCDHEFIKLMIYKDHILQ